MIKSSVKFHEYILYDLGVMSRTQKKKKKKKKKKHYTTWIFGKEK